MPAGDRVVSNTSPILNLALIDRLDLLRVQFESVLVPEKVWDELLEGEAGLESIRRHRDQGTVDIVPVEETDLFLEFQRELDRGESAALAYAIESGPERLLLDEREARAAAKRHGLSRTGVIGVLLRGAKERRRRSRGDSGHAEMPLSTSSDTSPSIRSPSYQILGRFARPSSTKSTSP